MAMSLCAARCVSVYPRIKSRLAKFPLSLPPTVFASPFCCFAMKERWSRDRCCCTVWGYSFDPGTNIVDVHCTASAEAGTSWSRKRHPHHSRSVYRGSLFFVVFRSLRTRLAVFFAALIAAVLLAFGSAVYVAAVVMEAHETESQTEKEHELRQVRHLLYVSLSLGIPLGAVLAALGSYWMTRRTLRAMSDIVETASALAPDGPEPADSASPRR